MREHISRPSPGFESLSNQKSKQKRSLFAPRLFPENTDESDSSVNPVQQSFSADFNLSMMDIPLFPPNREGKVEKSPPRSIAHARLMAEESSDRPSETTQLESEIESESNESVSSSVAPAEVEATPTPTTLIEDRIAAFASRVADEEARLEEKLAGIEAIVTGLEPEAAQEHRLQLRHSYINTLEATYNQYIAFLMRVGEDEKAFNASERIQTIEHVTLYETDPQAGLPETLDLAGVQNQILDEDTAILQYTLLPGQSYAWVITQDSMTSYELPEQSASGGQRAVTSYTRGVMAGRLPHDALRQRSVHAANYLKIPEIVQELSDFSRIAIVRDEELQWTPFDSLPITQDPKGESIVDRYEVVNIPSATSLAISREQFDNREIVNEAESAVAAIVAVADFEGEEHDLLGVKKEADNVAAAIPGDEERLDNEAATLDAIQGLANNDYKIIHFASHGVASKLIISTGEQDIEVTVAQVAALDLSTELLVMAMCQSGIGTDSDGDLALGYALLAQKGVPAVVTTQWKIHDEATAEFMAYFYGAMYGSGQTLSASEALQQAKLKMRQPPTETANSPNNQNQNQKKTDYSNPYFWTGFRLEGDWRP